MAPRRHCHRDRDPQSPQAGRSHLRSAQELGLCRGPWACLYSTPPNRCPEEGWGQQPDGCPDPWPFTRSHGFWGQTKAGGGSWECDPQSQEVLARKAVLYIENALPCYFHLWVSGWLLPPACYTRAGHIKNVQEQQEARAGLSCTGLASGTIILGWLVLTIFF